MLFTIVSIYEEKMKKGEEKNEKKWGGKCNVYKRMICLALTIDK